MGTLVGTPPEASARTGPVDQEWARIDPVVYLTEGRRAQARAVAEALGAARRGLAKLRRRVTARLAGRSERRRAIAQLMQLDQRLLTDIGLRRSDIELAVDGLLADPRVTRRTPAAAAVATEQPVRMAPPVVAEVTADANRPAAPAQPERPTELAA